MNALNSEQWCIWLAEVEGEIVSHIYIELINKVPRPGGITNPFEYMTNVYKVEKYRGNGIGSELISTVNKWVNDMKFEFVIVWPSEEGVKFYTQNGYKHCKEPMEYFSK